MISDTNAIRAKAPHNNELTYSSKIVLVAEKRSEIPQPAKKHGKTISIVFRFPNFDAMPAKTSDKAIAEITPALKYPIIDSATKGIREK
jgi:hypothetical protein